MHKLPLKYTFTALDFDVIETPPLSHLLRKRTYYQCDRVSGISLFPSFRRASPLMISIEVFVLADNLFRRPLQKYPPSKIQSHTQINPPENKYFSLTWHPQKLTDTSFLLWAKMTDVRLSTMGKCKITSPRKINVCAFHSIFDRENLVFHSLSLAVSRNSFNELSQKLS